MVLKEDGSVRPQAQPGKGSRPQAELGRSLHTNRAGVSPS